MSLDPLSVAFPAIGLFQDESVAAFTKGAASNGLSFIESATNISIVNRRYQTRFRWIERPCTAAPKGWSSKALQGLIPYDPNVGSTLQNPGTGDPGMIESAAGQMFRIHIGQNDFSVEDISSGIVGLTTMRIAWMAQAANYVIRTDGSSPTQIWDGSITTTSTGYNINAPSSSRLPNFAGPLAYTDRVWIVNNGNEVIAGDHIHRTDNLENTDLLKTTDQTYDITSTSFPAPADLGDILSMHIVTSSRGGDLPAQAEIATGTDGPGMWGVISGTPRARWNQTSMRRIIHPRIGPTGQYAAWASNDELIFRTKSGISSIKNVNDETQKVGNPYINLAQEISPLLDKDPSDLLMFTSLHVSQTQQRLVCTLWPVVDGTHRWSRGYVSAALSPGRSRMPEPMVWESVNTLPTAMGEVIQFCEVRSTGRRRLFAMVMKPDMTKGLAELTDTMADDLLADGTAVPIPWQILTRKLSPKSEYSPSSWGDVHLNVANIRDKATIRILARNRVDMPFELFWEETITNGGWDTEFDGLADSQPISLGSIFTSMNSTPWLQILIQGEGCCAVDLAIGTANGGSPTSSSGPVVNCISGEKLCQFDIFRRS